MPIAVDVSLFCSAFDFVAVPLSETLSLSVCRDSPHYTLCPMTAKRLSTFSGYTHCTLLRALVDSENILKVREVVKSAWNTHRFSGELDGAKLVLERVDAEPSMAVEGHTVYSPFITVTSPDVLVTLRKELIAALKPFHLTNADHAAVVEGFCQKFPLDPFFSSKETDALFPELSTDEETPFAPSISLGVFSGEAVGIQQIAIRPTVVPLRSCHLVVSRMGGFLSCREIL